MTPRTSRPSRPSEVGERAGVVGSRSRTAAGRRSRRSAPRGCPRAAAASIVASQSTATVTRASPSARHRLGGVTRRRPRSRAAGRRRARPRPCPIDLEWCGAGERAMADRELLRRERGALVRLHVRAAAAARKRRGHRRRGCAEGRSLRRSAPESGSSERRTSGDANPRPLQSRPATRRARGASS